MKEKEEGGFVPISYPNISDHEFLSMMIAYKDAMYDFMEGTTAEEFMKYEDLFCAATTIVKYCLKEIKEK